MRNNMENSTSETRTIKTADGNSLEYQVIGDGPPVVFLHGFLANRFTFSRQIEAFADHHKLILINLRGSAGSNFLVPENYGIATTDLDDLRTILDAERLNKVNLFCHSSGGAVGFLLAMQSPERVDRAILLEPSLFRLMPVAKLNTVIEETNAVVNVAQKQGPYEGLKAAIISAAGDAWTNLDQQTQEKRLSALAGSAAFVGPHFLSLIQLDITEEDVENLKPSALLIYGANSFWFEQFIAERFRQIRPDIKILTIENASHNVHRDQANTVNKEALTFLSN